MENVVQHYKNELISDLKHALTYDIGNVDVKNYQIDIADVSSSFAVLCSTLGIVFSKDSTTYKALLDGKAIDLQYFKKTGLGFTAMVRDSSGNIRQPDFQKAIYVGNTAKDFAMLCVAIALNDINKKLDNIIKAQSDLLEFITEDKKADMRANCLFLNDVISNYQLNADNKLYKANNHIKALDIKQSSMGNIEFYQKIILNRLKKGKLFYTESKALKFLNKIENDLHNYQLSLYLFSYSSLVEIILLENYSKEYLESILERIDAYRLTYREIYTLCYNTLEKSIDDNVLRSVFNNVDRISKNLEKTLLKNPAYKLLKNKYRKENTKKRKELTKPLLLENTKEDPTRLFFDSINLLNQIYNYAKELHIKNNKLHVPIYF